MSITNNMLRITLMCTVSFILFSCDKDVSDIGGSVLTNTSILTKEFNNTTIETENISLESIQSNNLTGGYLFGTSKNENTGDVSYGVLFRVEPTTSTNFSSLTGEISGQTVNSVKFKSANLIIPYTYTIESTSQDTNEINYQIEGIINEEQALSLDVFKSNYNLELNSSSSNTPQPYYANAFDEVNFFSDKIEAGGSILKEVVDANPKADTFTVKTVDDEGNSISSIALSNIFEEEKKTLRVSLNEDFLGSDIINTDGTLKDISILNTDRFLDNFKGVYLKPKGTNNNLVSLFDNSVAAIQPKIEITFEVVTDFSEVKDAEGNVVTEAETKTTEEIIDFNMNQQVVNIVEHSKGMGFNTAFGAKEIAIVKGGASASRIELFKGTEELKSFYAKNPIINQAILKFQVNKDPSIYKEENVPDYLLINSLESGAVVSESKLSEDNTTYDFDITAYLKRIFNSDTEQEAIDLNVDLIIGLSDLEGEEARGSVQFGPSLSIFDNDEKKRINIASLQSIKEVPLYGSGAAVDNKPQLIIKYTVTK